MKNTPKDLILFIQSVARIAAVNYDTHAKVDIAVKELLDSLTNKEDGTPK